MHLLLQTVIPANIQPEIKNLHDIVLPEPISWVWQTVGWWVVFALLGLLLVWVGYQS